MRTTLSRPLLMASALGALALTSALFASPSPAPDFPSMRLAWSSEPPQVMEKFARPIVWSKGGMKLSLVGLGVGREWSGQGSTLQLLITYRGLPEGWRFDDEPSDLVGPPGSMPYVSSTDTGMSGRDGSAVVSLRMPPKGASILREFSGRFDNQHGAPRAFGPYTTDALKSPTLLKSPIAAVALQLFDWTLKTDATALSDIMPSYVPDMPHPALEPGYGYPVFRFYMMSRGTSGDLPEMTIHGADGTSCQTMQTTNYCGPSGVNCRRPYFGIGFDDPYGQTSRDLKGVRVVTVKPGGPAEKAGVRPGDVLLKLGSMSMGNHVDPDSMPSQLATPGEPVTMVVRRDGEKLSLSITPTEDPRWADMSPGASEASDRLSALIGSPGEGTRPGDEGYCPADLVEITFVSMEPVPAGFRPETIEFSVPETIKAGKSISFSLKNIRIPVKIRKAIDAYVRPKNEEQEIHVSTSIPLWLSKDMTVRNLEKPIVWKQDGATVTLRSIGRGRMEYDKPDDQSLLAVIRYSGLPAGLQFSSGKAIDQSGGELRSRLSALGMPGQSGEIGVAFPVGKREVTSLRELSGEFDNSRRIPHASAPYAIDDLKQPQSIGDRDMAVQLFDLSVNDLPTHRVSLGDLSFMGGTLPLPALQPGHGYLTLRLYGLFPGDGKYSPSGAEFSGADGVWHKMTMEFDSDLCLTDGTRSAPPYLGVQVRLMQDHDDRIAKIGSVDPVGPTAKAGIRAGDVVARVGSKKVSGDTDLFNALGELTKPGIPITLTVIRGGKPVSITVTPAPDPLWADMHAHRQEADSKLEPYVRKGKESHLAGLSYTYSQPVPLDFHPESVRLISDVPSIPTKTVKFSFKNVPIPDELRHAKK